MQEAIAIEGGTSGGARTPDSGHRSLCVSTKMTFPASPEEVWNWLTYYEQIRERPPLHLRLLLPVPARTEGQKGSVGDESRCVYDRGHLVKRVTAVQRGSHFSFDIVEQALAIGGGMKLSRGAYTLRGVPNGTEVVVATHYLSTRRPRWLWKRIEATVCHAFHRHILRAMRRNQGASTERS